MQPPNYQPYPPAYQPYPAQKPRGGGSALAIIAFILALIALVLSVVLNLDAFKKAPAAATPSFTVSDYTISTSSSDYTYSTYVYYDGTGSLTTSDTENDYIVVLKANRLYGGSTLGNSEYNIIVEVINGTGNFYTYDSGYDTEVTMPNYDFTVVGWVKLDK
jgi:hypothetical protein